MMNLELLFWASRASGNKDYYKIAVTHAETTMKNHIRPDSTTFHVILYDSVTGNVIRGVTAQGANDSSMWARGQAWGIYGFTMCYRETHRLDFLETAEKLAHKFVEELPSDFIPYWDFNAPNIPDEEKDASAAAIAASGMLELSMLVVNPAEKKFLRTSADKILRGLINNYLSDGTNVAILEHSVGNKPANSEVDVPLIYADYYFFEALMREKKIQETNPEACD
jgi:unsaturated chondroitin disaccharide hydrolase